MLRERSRQFWVSELFLNPLTCHSALDTRHKSSGRAHKHMILLYICNGTFVTPIEDAYGHTEIALQVNEVILWPLTI